MIPLVLGPRRWSLAPYIALLVGWAAITLAAGVPVADLVRYATYEAAFVLVPGVLAAAALMPNLRPGILLFAVGAGLGLALELGAYIGAATIGYRSLFVLYPVAVTAAAGLLMSRRRRMPSRHSARLEAGAGQGRSDRSLWSGPAGVWHAWVTSAIALVALVLLALGMFPLTPAVTPATSPVYHQDLVFNVSIAAELQRRIPPTLPQVAGLPFVYHWFVNAHLAAVASVTGVDLWTLVSRLFPTAWLAIVVMQVAAVGSAMTGRNGPVPWPRSSSLSWASST